jgi:predicted PurR-regulated permease PerM
LLGAGRVRVSTQAMDDAADSIGRYLLMQSLVNLAYGSIVTLLLVCVGIPNALLWGVLAALSRFIPYFGPGLGAALPLFLSLAVFPGWMPFLVLAACWLSLESPDCPPWRCCWPRCSGPGSGEDSASSCPFR